MQEEMIYETEEERREDTNEDVMNGGLYDNNSISAKKSFIIFGVVVASMLTIFILDTFKIIPWWGTLISSVLVVAAGLIPFLSHVLTAAFQSLIAFPLLCLQPFAV